MFWKLYQKNRAQNSAAGFTLIELLVVIAIIGLLSSVVLASLGSVRLRARDAAIKQIVAQMRAIMATQFAENPASPYYFGGSNPQRLIANDASGTFVNSCDTRLTAGGFTTENYNNLLSLCNQLAKLVKPVGTASAVYVFLGFADFATLPAPCSTANNCYTLIVRLPSGANDTYYCASGILGFNGQVSAVDTGAWTSPGCWRNP
jgi:prepilin-type N-terminal cleavage/methylation domain-containing protein